MKMRNVLNISKHDSIGRRFNNLDARLGIGAHNWNAKFCCWTPRTESEDFVQQASGNLNRYVTKALAKVGRYTGNINGYYANANAIKSLSFYEEADLLHFHIVHEEYLSINDWKSLAKNKPVVWTWHDPYMLNGHCIYSLGCSGFESGCQSCPNLDYHFPIKRDRSSVNLEEKRAAVKSIDPLILVASEYMKELVGRSVYADSVRIKVLPFGVETHAIQDQQIAKRKLGIPLENTVIGFRAVHSDYKGTSLVKAALARFSEKYPNYPLTIIAFQEKGFCRDLSPKYQIIDTGWVSDSSIHDYYAAMDFFLMPSKAEAFGLMAIEAMAAGACPIVTYGTALPDLVCAPMYALCSEHSVGKYSNIVEEALLNNKFLSSKRSKRQKYAETEYSMSVFCQTLANIYDEEYEYCTANRRSSG